MSSAAQHLPSESPARGTKNRRTGKAVLAGAVAVGLLAAGGGTFSQWSDDRDVFAAGTSVSTGKLQLGDVRDTRWTDQHGTIDLATFEAVPGDTLTFRTVTTLQAEGKNLKGTLALDLPDAVQQAIADDVLDYRVTMTGLQDTDADGAYTVTGDVDDDREVTVTATFTWNADSVDGLEGQGLTGLSLDETQLLLTQDV